MHRTLLSAFALFALLAPSLLVGCSSSSAGSPAPTESESATTAGSNTSAEACTVDADCSGGGHCNCRCVPGEACDGPADACGDCAQWNMTGICLPSCEGG